ncbi:ComEC/Rec2 family competence protein [Helicobacter sp. MIT 99-5507]|uniref:ComEC/Rec2 family competence protein n=1 Tax=Helicobacter sp. MIT 99-5507 TaxID=152489 RepID=UPI000E1F0144|nr:ComEC/Rec2 family competence protein [Helicobacter sp. MIT 99-5507]RDU56639.1 hypothetical protein CQA42_07435 [Helicobacter sp. MIT 99-5507]
MKTIHSPLEVDFISSKKDIFYIAILIIVIFCLSLYYEFYKYQQLSQTKNINITAKVLLQYKKKDYFVLKLKDSSGATFYTTSRDDLIDLKGKFIRIYGILNKNCNFLNYLKSCYIISFEMSLLHKKDYRDGIIDYINSQHNDFYFDGAFDINLLGSLYNGIFLATPMDKKILDFSASLGIAHIFAISGFHLGILSFVLYLILSPLYRIFQKRYFSYRNEFYDINFIVLFFAFLYLIVLDFNPSFLRSFAMFAFGLFVLYNGISLLSYKLLFTCIVFILALFPKIFFSVGFWLSCAGVFYIYLYLQYFKSINKIYSLFLLNIIVFLNMLIIAHYFFYVFSPWQIISPLLTIAFVVFYPLMLFLHIIDFGFILDSPLLLLINYDFFNVELQTPLWLLCVFLISSFMAIFSKKIYYLVLLISILYFLYGIFLSFRGI